MTDEEKLAEEYVKSVIDVNAFDWKIVREIYLAFLEGLKAGRPKWHDLRKDPNDLPKEDCETVTLHESGNKNIIKWKYGNWTNAIIIPVIAWCEIPTFTDKE